MQITKKQLQKEFTLASKQIKEVYLNKEQVKIDPNYLLFFDNKFNVVTLQINYRDDSCRYTHNIAL